LPDQLSVSAPLPEERGQWQQLYRGYADFYQVPMDDHILDTVWSWIHDETREFFALVARDGSGKLRGLMHYRAMPSPLRGRTVGFLDDLFVAPEARGKGVVQALFRELEASARTRDWPLIRWITAEDNARARAVYDQLSEQTHWVTYQMNLD
jgi:ribosomal protein S18 acetylase RimI-like enzyme